MTEVVVLPGLDGTTALLEGFCSSLASLGVPARAVAYPSDRPLGYSELEPLARAQLRHGPVATSLLHTTVRFEDPPIRRLVQLLDGSRTLDQVAADLLPAFPPEHRPGPEDFRAGLERNLAVLAQNGFLVS